MIDLTPLDVRKKRGDFGKGLRGYDPQEVDGFLELVAERMEELVKENLAFREKVERLGERVVVQEGREQAIQDALVTAQELRQDVKKQASREAKLMEREARGRIESMIGESEKRLAEHRTVLEELERHRDRFLKSFRTFLERELDTVEVEFGRAPLEEVTLDLDLGKASWSIGADEDNDEDDEEGKDDKEHRSQQDEHEAGVNALEGTGEVADESESQTAEVALVADDSLGAGSAFPEEEHEEEHGVTDAEADDAAAAESGAAEKEYGVAGAEDAPTTDSAAPEEKYGVPEANKPPPSEEQDGGDSLWLSSIMNDREEDAAE